MDQLPPGPSAVGRRLTILLVTVGLSLGATACSKNDDEPRVPSATVGSAPPATTTTEPATTTTTVEDVKAEVEAAYLKAEAAYYDALEDPDPSDPRLEVNRTADNIAVVREYASYLAELGQVARYPSGKPKIEVESVEVSSDGASAVLVSCIVDKAQVIEEKSRKVIDDDIVSRQLEIVLELDERNWKISSGQTLAAHEGEEGCG